MSGVLILCEVSRGRLRGVSGELIAAGRALCDQGAGSLTVALIDHRPEEHLDDLDLRGVEEVLLVPTPLERFEAHVSRAALEALIARRRPAVVLAGQTPDSLAFLPAVAARARHGYASDVTDISWAEQGLGVKRALDGGRLIATLDFPGKDTVLVQMLPAPRTGIEPDAAAAPGAAAGTGAAAAPGAAAEHREPTAEVSRLELELAGSARTEQLQLHEPAAGERDLAKADFVLSIGRGACDQESVATLSRLAERIGATLAVSGALVEGGLAPGVRKVGQSGRSVAPLVYLALGISGAPQHLAGISGARMIIAVNSDPGARIFDIAHYGAVADLFEVAAELERQLA